MPSVKPNVTNLLVPIGFRHHRAEIEAVAQRHSLDPVLVAAVCWQESSFNADAYRFEPDFFNRYMKLQAEYKTLNPRRYSASYGLMQPMWIIAVEEGYDKALPPEGLFTPSIGLEYGCRRLFRLLQWANARLVPSEIMAKDPNIRVLIALSAYNGGRGGNDPAKNWPLRNAKYAREVLAKYAVITKEFA